LIYLAALGDVESYGTEISRRYGSSYKPTDHPEQDRAVAWVVRETVPAQTQFNAHPSKDAEAQRADISADAPTTLRIPLAWRDVSL
jgi:hypothetical protein